MSLVGHTSRRHPLCPSCGYDLVATIERDGVAGMRTCPECGVTFEPQDIVRAPAPDDWTFVRGVRSLAAALSMRSVVWVVVFLLVAWIFRGLGTIAQAYANNVVVLGVTLVGGLALLATGAALGVVVGRKAEEHAGFSGGLLATILITWCVICAIGACTAAEALGLMAASTAGIMGTIIAALAIVLVVREQLIEAY